VEELASSRWDGNLEIAVEGCIHSKKEEEDNVVASRDQEELSEQVGREVES
jgi:hypothetical protein